MKTAVNALIVIAVIVIVIAVISRLTLTPLIPVINLESRAMVGFAGILLLLAIALSVKK